MSYAARPAGASTTIGARQPAVEYICAGTLPH